jgi:hydroxymethylbilane synthase
MSRPVIIGTRGSKLALVQAEQTAAALRQQHPGLAVELQIISTKGDRILDVALSQVGDKGLFVKEIEIALAQGEIDLAVHSCKDLPSLTPEGLTLAAFPQRADPRDALVLPEATRAALAAAPTSLDVLPQGAIVGTSSLRRASQLRALRPDLHLHDVRGNVETRLRKLNAGDYDALILASAGLDRLGMQEHISLRLPDDMLLPAVAQGALALEARSDDSRTLELLQPLNDAETHTAVLAERACLRRLEGGCQVPIAAHAEIDLAAGSFHLRGLVAALDGSSIVRGERMGRVDNPEEAGLALADELLANGAMSLLAEQHTGGSSHGG